MAENVAAPAAGAAAFPVPPLPAAALVLPAPPVLGLAAPAPPLGAAAPAGCVVALLLGAERSPASLPQP